MTIGTLAQKTGVGIEAIRFYERERLLEKPLRKNHSNYRHYGPDAIKRLKFILKAKSLGFSLKEIKELLLLRLSTVARCDAVKKKTANKISDVEKKMEDLSRIKHSLQRLMTACDEKAPTGKCPLLNFLEVEDF